MKEKMLLILLAISMSMFAGCGKKQSAEDIIKESKDKIANFESIGVNISGNMGISMEDCASGVKADFYYNLVADRTVFDGWHMSIEGIGKMETNEERKYFSSKNYMAVDKNTLFIYKYDNDNQSWTYKKQPCDEGILTKLFYKECKTAPYKLRKNTVKIDERECYVIDHTIQGSELGRYLSGIWNKVKGIADSKTSGIEDEMLELLGDVESSMHGTLYINKRSMMPYKYELELKDILKELVEIVNDFSQDEKESNNADNFLPDMLGKLNMQDMSFSIEVVFEEFNNEPVTIPRTIISHATEEYMFSVDPNRIEMDETDLLYEKPECEEQDISTETDKAASYDLTEEELEKALDELESLDWNWD